MIKNNLFLRLTINTKKCTPIHKQKTGQGIRHNRFLSIPSKIIWLQLKLVQGQLKYHRYVLYQLISGSYLGKPLLALVQRH